MLVLRGTKKLRDRLKGATANPSDTSTTALGDWFATALFTKPQIALVVNRRTLLPVLLPLAPAATLVRRLPDAIAATLRRHGASEEFVAAELAAMREVRVAPTNDRSTLGVMNEFVFQVKWSLEDGETDLDVVSERLPRLLVGPLIAGPNGSPDRELQALLRSLPGAFDERRVTREPGLLAGPGGQTQLFQLHVTLRGIEPAVWRRIVVYPTTPLDRLHEYLQAAFGWWDYHLYEFAIGGQRYGVPDDEWDIGPPVKNAHRTRLNKAAAVGDTFVYSYDFGDGWEHEVVVEAAVPVELDAVVPACIDGRRACPPEDCGGPWGYEELLAILADPSHPEHEARVLWAGDWGGGRLDPEAFDVREFAEHRERLRLAALEHRR